LEKDLLPDASPNVHITYKLDLTTPTRHYLAQLSFSKMTPVKNRLYSPSGKSIPTTMITSMSTKSDQNM
jgi:hypothetical protein